MAMHAGYLHVVSYHGDVVIIVDKNHNFLMLKYVLSFDIYSILFISHMCMIII